jgi:hypothetical protein
MTACAASEPTAKTYRFLLPDGYRGALKLKTDSEADQPQKNPDEIYLINVPQDGVVRMRSLSGFGKWHKVSAQYLDGTFIPHGVGEMPLDAVGFFSLWTDADGQTFYLIGTRAEYEQIQKAGPWEIEKHFPQAKTQPPSSR